MCIVGEPYQVKLGAIRSQAILARIEGSETTGGDTILSHNTSKSARHPFFKKGDDIVRAHRKLWEYSYVTDGNGVSIERPASRAASAGFAVAGVAAETIAAGDYGLVQVWGYHSATRVRNMTGGSPAMAAGNPLAINAAGSVFCLENFDTGSNQLLVYPCAFALGKTTKWTTAAVAVFIKAL